MRSACTRRWATAISSPSRQREYRAEVNRRLFGLSQQAYQALIELLIRLRAPQLSKKLDEKSLFEALSNALPPLAADVVDQVASAFKQLDDLRQKHKGLLDLTQALTQFRGGYQTYMQTALLRRAQAVTSSHSRYESAKKSLESLQQTIDAGNARKAEAEAGITQCEDHLTGCTARLDTLNSSPEATQVKDLDNAEQAEKEKQRLFDQAHARSVTADESLAARSRELGIQTEAEGKARTDRQQHERKAAAHAADAAFAEEHAEVVPHGDAWPPDAKLLSAVQSAHRKRAGDHLYRLEQIEAEQRKVADTAEDLKRAHAQEAQAHEQMENARAQVPKHQLSAERRLAELAAAYVVWRKQLRWLAVPDWLEPEPAFTDWLDTDAADHRVLSATVAAAVQKETVSFTSALRSVEAIREQMQEQLAVVEHEMESLAAAPAVPVIPKTRSSAALAGQADRALPSGSCANFSRSFLHRSAPDWKQPWRLPGCSMRGYGRTDE